jgi:hypothetical protein
LALSGACTNFSASANVPTDTSGPTGDAVPNAGGAPGGSAPEFWAALRQAAADAAKAIDAPHKNCLRDFDMHHIVPAAIAALKNNMCRRSTQMNADNRFWLSALIWCARLSLADLVR